MTTNKKYRILQVCVDLDGGGIDRYLYNYCTRIEDIHFDFVKVDRGIVGMLEPLFEERGSKIFSVQPQSAGFRDNYKRMKTIMMNGRYDAVHVHLGYMGFLALLCAKRCGIKTRIVHAHIANEPESKATRLKRAIFTPLTKWAATDLAACGVDAAKWQWGENVYKNGKAKVINNAIDTKKFTYNKESRQRIRKDFSLEDTTLVFGNVGRIGHQKNQLRLLEIFAEIKKIHPDSQLWLVGNREYSEEQWNIKKREFKLGKEVKELGIRNDVPELLNAMDAFVFPSLYEGLPFTLVETQCNGLPSISADTVTSLVKVGDCLSFCSLNQSNEVWAQLSVGEARRGHSPQSVNDVIKGGYDLDTEANHLREYYIDLLNRHAK